jgi:hypothetical protein
MHRTLTWLNNDCLRYWKNEVFHRQEQHVRAKIALSSRQSFERSLQGTPSSCVDERKALQKAQRRLDHARKKLAAVRTWTQQLEKARNEYRARTQGLNTAVTTDIPNARAALDRMTVSLQAYLKLAPPEVPLDDVLVDAADSSASSVHRPTPEDTSLPDTNETEADSSAVDHAKERSEHEQG